MTEPTTPDTLSPTDRLIGALNQRLANANLEAASWQANADVAQAECKSLREEIEKLQSEVAALRAQIPAIAENGNKPDGD